MRFTLLGLLLILHGLAHAGAGMWTFDIGPAWLLSAVWAVAMGGFVAAGLGVLGVPRLRAWWPALAYVATAASVTLLATRTDRVLAAGMAVDLVVLLIVAGAAHGQGRALAHHESGRRHPVAARVGAVFGVALLAYVSALAALRPWYAHWGTTAAERREALPGDELIPNARYQWDHAITIDAPADSVWQWLAQIGQDRGGFYSYTGLERLIGAHISNASHIVPEWQHREVGDIVPATQAGYLAGILDERPGWRVARFEPGRALVLEGWGSFVVTPVDEHTSRLHIRTRGEGRPTFSTVPLAPFGLMVFEPAHFLMQRQMLRGIRARAEGRVG